MNCPPCERGQHEHCYNIQLADAGAAGQVCDCLHRLTPEQHREVFTGAIHEWLELNGVTFADPIGAPPFACTVDLNKLKVGMAELIRAFGGEYR